MDFEIINRYKTYHNLKQKKIFFFHVPKCGGLSISHSLSCSIKSFRIDGMSYNSDKDNESTSQLIKEKKLHAEKNYKINLDSYTAKEIYNKTKDISENYTLISGHLPFKEYKNINERITFTVLREPIARAKSSYLFEMQRNSSINSLEELYDKKIIFPNLMTSFFSSFKNPNVEIAIQNLNKINIVININQIKDLLAYIISCFELPNMILTKINKTKFIKELTAQEETLLAEKNNLDIKFFEQAQKKIFNFDEIEKDEMENELYSLFTVDKLFNNSNSIIFPATHLNEVTDLLKKV